MVKINVLGLAEVYIAPFSYFLYLGSSHIGGVGKLKMIKMDDIIRETVQFIGLKLRSEIGFGR